MSPAISCHQNLAVLGSLPVFSESAPRVRLLSRD